MGVRLLSVKQTASVISIYAADVSGVASALFELGGMTVLHDASGCNSTYNTHDEPRWYDNDSMVFISALSEMEAIMGDDDKLIRDIEETAADLTPAFIAIAGTPIPMMMGTDLPAIAAVIEHDTGIPCFGLATNSMHSYISGAGMAFEALAERIVTEPRTSARRQNSVNILGMTPLDFSVNGTDDSLRTLLSESGFSVVSTWAMGSTLDEIRRSSEAAVNLVVSACGLPAALELKRRFGTPFVTGLPIGEKGTSRLLDSLRRAAAKTDIKKAPASQVPESFVPDVTLIGESVASCALAEALEDSLNVTTRVLCPLETQAELLRPQDAEALDETDILPYLKGTRLLIADPLYRPICPSGATFLPLPSEGFSGRIYRREIPDLIRDYKAFCEKTGR